MSTTPFRAARAFTDQYHEFIQLSLMRKGVSHDSVESLLAAMEMDSGLYLSSNPQYRVSHAHVLRFFEEHRLSIALGESIAGKASHLFVHQEQAIESILNGRHTIIATGTGSGKTEAFLIPLIADSAYQLPIGVRALIIYPMNALANDQMSRLSAYCEAAKVTFGIYTGETDQSLRQNYRSEPPQILVTNYVMLERLIMRDKDREMLTTADALRYIVLDELHSYSGSRAAHLKFLLARLRDLLGRRDQVMIGTSATLTRGTSGKKRLDSFLRHLWDVGPDDYKLIQGEELPITMIGDPLPMPDFSDGAIPSVEQDVHPYHFRFLERMLGVTLGNVRSAGRPENDPVFLEAQRNPFLDMLRHRLKDGAMSVGDMVAILETVMPPEHLPTVERREALVSAYLQVVGIVNQRFIGSTQPKPLLDYRLHLFVRHLVGYLKRCPICGRYYSGDRDFCPDDGYSLYPVCRENVQQMIAKVRLEGELSGWVDREGDEKPPFTFVRMLRVSEVLPSDSAFTLFGKISPLGKFLPAEESQIALAPLTITDPEKLHPLLIELCEESTNFEQVQHLVGSLLAPYKPADKRSLGFVDQRERASQLSAALRDDFASAYLRAFAAFHWQDWEGSALKALERLQAKAETRSKSLPEAALEREFLAEIGVWFWRELSRGADDGSHFQVCLREERLPDDLTPVERALLEAFIRERRFYRDDAVYQVMWQKAEHAQHIRFELWRVGQHLGIAFASGEMQRQYSALSLSAQSVVLADLIAQYPLDALRAAMEDLNRRGLLASRTISLHEEGSVDHYYLPLDFVRIMLDEPVLEDEDTIRRDYLLTARAHTAELDKDQRREVEKRFRSDDEQQAIHFVVATPTLEMGIDIGQLQSVIMFGAPPSPANYAQRAGRAGRSRKHEGYYDALIVTLCFAYSDHDMRAYDDPCTMIDGAILAPGFNPQSEAVLRRHINAVVLRSALKDVESLNAYLQKGTYVRDAERLRRIFGIPFDYAAYLASDAFAPALHRMLQEQPPGQENLREYLYHQAVLPEYGFSRETVKAISSSSKKHSLDDDENPFAIDQRVVAERTVEQAFRLFIPGQTAYLSDNIFRVTGEGQFDLLPYFHNARQYQEIEVRPEQWFARKLKFRNRYRIASLIALSGAEMQEWGGVLRTGFAPSCYLAQINYGGDSTKKAVDLSNALDAFPFGYQIERPALLLDFDTVVCDDLSSDSLIAVLFKTIVEHYGMGRGEIALNLDSKEPNDSMGRYAVLYDADGNGNIPFKRIAAELPLLWEKARDRLTICDCEDGCERCLYSFEMQRYTSLLSKRAALEFCDYLLGQGRFVPKILPFKDPVPKPDLWMHVHQQGDYCIEAAALRRCVSVEELYAEMARMVGELYQPGMKVLRLSSQLDWVVNAINKREVKSRRQGFAQLVFQLLRFETVIAIKE